MSDHKNESFLQRAFRATQNSGLKTKIAIAAVALTALAAWRLDYLTDASQNIDSGATTTEVAPTYSTTPQP